MLALSVNQIALVDLTTMKPIRARNGSGWFESITALNILEKGLSKWQNPKIKKAA